MHNLTASLQHYWVQTTAVTNLTIQCPEFISTQFLKFCQCLLPMQSILKHPNIILEIPSVIFQFLIAIQYFYTLCVGIVAEGIRTRNSLGKFTMLMKRKNQCYVCNFRNCNYTQNITYYLSSRLECCSCLSSAECYLGKILVVSLQTVCMLYLKHSSNSCLCTACITKGIK